LLTLYGTAKPVYRAFQLLHRLGDKLIDVQGEHETLSAWAVRDGDTLMVLLINHAMPRHPISTAIAQITIAGAPQPRAAFVERIDADHANPRAAWVEMGQPKYLRPRQVEQLEATSRLVKEPIACRYEQGVIEIGIDLPAHAVAALTIELTPAE
jgi:xylan 1,4-beta-xylosidase